MRLLRSPKDTMRTRHRPPSLVSMWMLDVFCCALGCVTLLWLLSTRDARDEAARNRTSVEQLARTESELRAAVAAAEATERRLTGEKAALAARLSAEEESARGLSQQLAEAKQTLAAADAKLASESAKSSALAAERDRSAARAGELAARLAASTEAASGSAKSLKDAEQTLAAAQAQLAQLKGDLARAQVASKARQDGMAAADAQSKQLQNELAAARASLIDLQGQKAKLADQFDKLKADAESRFAGVTLTGRKVVFLVDISGSMKLLDDKTPAPEKWDTVAETVAKVMRSLPDLAQFQLVVFSRRATVLLGSGWEDYAGEASVGRVLAALKRTVPDGDTNLYEAFELAFGPRFTGLDAVYLFSDGLPTSGPGLTATEERTLSVTDRSDKLAKHLLSTMRTTWNPRRPSGVGGKGANRVRVNCVGFFFESPDVGAFLWALARDNDGSFVGMSKP